MVWETVTPFLSDKGSQFSQISHVGQDNLISDDKNSSKESNNFCNMTVKSLDIKGPQVLHVNEDSDPMDIVLNEYVNHPSKLKVKKYFNEPTEFNLLEQIPNHIEKEIKH